MNASLNSTANGTTVTLAAYPLDQNQQLNTSAPQTLGSQPARAMCEADQLTASPNGKYLLIQYNCEAALFAILQNLETGVETSLARGYFLDWSPDGEWLLFRQTDNDEIWLIHAANLSPDSFHASRGMTAPDAPRRIPNLPPGTYNATFHPSGQQLITAASKGLGFGSELGTYDLVSQSYTLWQTFPDQIAAFPRWSPDGAQLAFTADDAIWQLQMKPSPGQPPTQLTQSITARHPAWLVEN
jgi:Tol biopolymer transport system component